MKYLAWIALTLSINAASYAKSPLIEPIQKLRNFSQVKDVLPDIYLGLERDFYCDCA